MNLGSKKAIIKAFLIIQTILIIAFFLSMIILLYFYFDSLHPYKEYLPDDFFTKEFLAPTLYFFLYCIYYSIISIYLRKKLNQNKEQFYKNLVPYRFIAVTSIFFGIFGFILMTISAFKKDDGQDEQPLYSKPKKPKKVKIKYPKDINKQLKAIKHQKKLGYISQELCEKKCNEIIKNYNNSIKIQ